MILHNIHELPELDDMLKGGYLVCRKHPTEPLFIYNYTTRAQYERVWNPTTLNCRGLIADDSGNIIVRPFPKFFNMDEHPRSDIVFSKPFTVTEKIDGSLGILYPCDNGYAIATCGSFEGVQAQWATQWLKANIPASFFDSSKTYLFEIVAKWNRIVVTYDYEGLVLLAVIDTKTGRDCSLPSVEGTPLRIVNSLDVSCKARNILEFLSLVNDGNTEGIVLRFDWPKTGPQTRMKVKLSEYVRLHRIITGVTEKRILEDFLMKGSSIDSLLEGVPDEFYNWVKLTIDKFNNQYREIEQQALQEFKAVKADTRKQYAEAFYKSPLRSILFLMLDNNDYSQAIWKMLVPDSSPFKVDEP
jgi:RNA ligase